MCYAGKAGTDDDDVKGFVVLFDARGRNAGIGGSRSHHGGTGGNGGLQKTAAA